MSRDITRVLEDWPYEPGKISVRKVVGDDGRPKIQLRLDLGLLQMETEGRPDGQRPNGYESLLEYFQHRLRGHQAEHGGPEGFQLSEEDCELLRTEAVMYYHRYLSEFALEDYAGVARDAARNLAVADICHQFAREDSDRMALEQYRPYIVMMLARAKAMQALAKKDFASARAAAEEGIERIREFIEGIGQPQLMESSGEVGMLRALLKEIEDRQPVDPLRELEKSLAQAIREERYEDAARLRDRLRSMRKSQEN